MTPRLRILLLGACLVLARASASTDYGHDQEHGRFATVNGIRLHYEIYGSGVPLVLLHGNGGDIAAMRHQIEHFRTQRQVIAIDSRGHGQSQLGAPPLTYEGIADDVAALLAELHAPPADVLGWSDGGIVALHLALRHPARVRSIALSGANLSLRDLQPEDVAGMEKELTEVRRKIASGDQTRAWPRVEQHLLLMLRQTPITAADLARITCPALVLAGEHDMIPEPHTRAIAAGLPHARLHLFRGAGHGALQEVPEEFNRVVEEFLSQGR